MGLLATLTVVFMILFIVACFCRDKLPKKVHQRRPQPEVVRNPHDNPPPENEYDLYNIYNVEKIYTIEDLQRSKS